MLGLPTWFLVVLLAVVFTAVLSIGQGFYWAWIARNEARQAEVLRRLGNPSEFNEEETRIFFDQEDDATALALGNMGEYLQRQIVMADAPFTVSTLLARCAILFGIGFVAGGIFLGFVGVFLGIPFGLLPILLVRRSAQQRARKLVEQLPDSLELISRSLQAGLGLTDALRLVAEEMPMPVSAEFGRVFEEIRFGRDYREAFEKLLNRNPGVFDLRLMVSSILLQRETGGNLIEILENIASTIRSRFVFEAKVRAMTAESKFSAIILGGLPVCVGLLMTVANPGYLSILFEEPLGNVLLLFSSMSYGLGIFIMRDISNVEV